MGFSADRPDVETFSIVHHSLSSISLSPCTPRSESQNVSWVSHACPLPCGCSGASRDCAGVIRRALGSAPLHTSAMPTRQLHCPAAEPTDTTRSLRRPHQGPSRVPQRIGLEPLHRRMQRPEAGAQHVSPPGGELRVGNGRQTGGTATCVAMHHYCWHCAVQ